MEEYTGVINTDGAHTDEYPFCTDVAGCPCHEDTWEITNTNEAIQDGLMTVGEADRYFRGKTI